MKKFTVMLMLFAAAMTAYGEEQRVASTSFQYIGAFKLPHENGRKKPIFSWGQRGMSFDPAGDPNGLDEFPGSLWLSGHDHAEDVFEIAIPVPLSTSDYGSLPSASLLTPAIDFTDGCNTGSDWLAGLEIHGNFIWASCANWYNVTGKSLPDVLWRRSSDLANLEGPFKAGGINDVTFHSNRQGAYLLSIPLAFASEHLGNKTLATGFSRNSHGGQLGPTLLAFDPEEPASALAVFYYRQSGSPDCGDKCDFPNYTPCDHWWGATWVDGGESQALLIGGRKYYGSVSYSGGWHCSPGFGEVIFYDSSDLAARTARKLKPWQVIPYEFWRPTELWNDTNEIGGMAFDQDSKILYLTERQAGGNGRSIVHVYRLGNLSNNSS